MAAQEKEVISINVDLTCDKKCELCEHFFDCKNPVKWEIYNRRRMGKAKETMRGIKHKIVITGGKGGVGKTLVAVNFATALAMRGYKVSILDQDYDGPATPKMLGVADKKMKIGEKGIVPVEALLGIQVISTGNIMERDEVLTWYYEMRRNAVENFLADVNYGQRDFLIIDVPPGTSADSVNVMQYIPEIAGMVDVTVPSEVSQNVAKKAAILAMKAGIRIFGVVENMSGYVCPKCKGKFEVLKSGGGEVLSKELEVPFLGKIPLDPIISESSDVGVPVVFSHPDSDAAKALNEIVDKVLTDLGIK